MQQEYFLNYVSKSKKDIIMPALKHIHENYTSEPLRIAALSQLCSITPEYFRSIFKSIYGISPKSYINNLKISRAKELLSSGMYSVTESAILSGYTDMSHFSREFKKATGVSPILFRSSLYQWTLSRHNRKIKRTKTSLISCWNKNIFVLFICYDFPDAFSDIF